MKLKAIALSLLVGVSSLLLAAPSLANTYTISPGQNAGAIIQSAQNGDTVQFGAGTFNINSPIVIPSGVTVQGVSTSQTHIVFNLNGDDSTSYGFSIAGNASNVTIQQLDMVSNHGIIQLSLGDPNTDVFNNIVITHNNFQYGGGQFSDGTIVFGIFVSMHNDGLKITYNYFHDSTGESTRNWEIWAAQNANVDNNLFYNIEDGGQFSSPGSNVSFSHNYGTHIHRMAQEGGMSAGSNMIIDGNVFYDWVNPYPDSDALSIVGPSAEIDYTNNFFQASIAQGSSWGPPDGGGMNRFGMAIEGTGGPGILTGNTFVGTWACCYSSTMPNAQAYNNTVYGGALWGNFDGEPGPGGYGSVNAYNNNIQPLSQAPAPPANTFAGPDFGTSTAAPNPAPTPAPNPPAIAATSSPTATSAVSTSSATSSVTTSSATASVSTPSATASVSTSSATASTASSDAAKAKTKAKAKPKAKPKAKAKVPVPAVKPTPAAAAEEQATENTAGKSARLW
jgi:hypothetical protein